MPPIVLTINVFSVIKVIQTIINILLGCSECTGPTMAECTLCMDTVFTKNGVCFSKCESGYFGNLTTLLCEPCQINCNECVNEKACITCNKNFYLHNNVCETTCPNLYFKDNVSW